MSTTIRVNSEIKEQVTPILNTLGISVSEAVNMFLHQVKIHNGIPFELTAPVHYPGFWEDVEETRKAVENGTAEFIRNDEELRRALGL